MKKLITLFLITIIGIANAQELDVENTFYTTDGKNRITKHEVDKMRIGIAEKASKALNKKLYAGMKIIDTQKSIDSVIHKITFSVSDKVIKDGIDKGVLYHLKGKELPGSILKTLTGSSFDVNNLKGKPSMINIWFAECPPCIDEMPFLNTLQKKYKEDFNFISMTYENKDKVKDFLKTHKYTFNHIIEAKKYIDALGVKSYPINIFLDKEGVVKHIESGLAYEKDKDGKMKIKDASQFESILKKLKIN